MSEARAIESSRWLKRGGVIMSLLLLAFSQALLVESLWWWLQPQDQREFGWKLGFIYALLCLFISTIHLLSALLEPATRIAQYWNATPMDRFKDPGALRAITLLAELTERRSEKQIALFLLPGREINAFSYSLNSQLKPRALFLTRGALNQLNRDQLKVLIARQIAALYYSSNSSLALLSLIMGGYCSVYFCGLTLLNQAGLGRWAPKEAPSSNSLELDSMQTLNGQQRGGQSRGKLIYFVGILPMLLGLPGWWACQAVLHALKPKEILSLDSQIAVSQEIAHTLIDILKLVAKFPHDDMPPTTWLMRSRGLHNEGFLEHFFPLQPPLNERITALEKRLPSLPARFI